MRSVLPSISAELLKTLDVLGMPAFIIAEDRVIAACNDSVQRIFGSRPDDSIGSRLERFLSLDHLPPSASLPGSPPSGLMFDTVCTRLHGAPFTSRAAVLAAGEGDKGLRLVVVRDTPPAAAPESTPPDRSAQIELISELSGIINSSLSIGTIFRMVVSELRNLISYDRASLLLYNETDDRLLIFALDTAMRTEMKKGVRAPIEGTSAGWVVRHNKPWISPDLTTTTFPLDRKLLHEGLRSSISIPLFHDRMLGVFNFDSTRPGAYSERDLEILLPVAKHIAIALENALLFEEISKEKKEWERTFDAITDMVWIEDARQRVVRANATLLAKTGLSKTEVIQKRCGELLQRIGIAPAGCPFAEKPPSRRPTFQELKGTGGGIFHFWSYPLLDEDGRLYAIVYYLKDVTAQKQLEQQLIRSDKLASLGTLVAGIAHEINNPLGIIAGYSEALLDRAHDPALSRATGFADFPEYLRTIHSEIFRCKGILKSLLEFARPSGGTFREIDINELIKEVLLLLKHRTQKLQHTISLDLDREVPKIYADAGSLRQLLMNLLLNAIYFTPEGGSISIRTAQDDPARDDARVTCPSRIRLSVSDTGAGIPPELLGRVFDPFFTTKPVGEGTGLGLTICYTIVEQHAGAIDVESTVGKGTTFVITLPSIECGG